MTQHVVGGRAYWLARLWWELRGVGTQDYRALCSRCGRTGQAHWALWKCWRFRAL
jgi:hypothetical protein